MALGCQWPAGGFQAGGHPQQLPGLEADALGGAGGAGGVGELGGVRRQRGASRGRPLPAAGARGEACRSPFLGALGASQEKIGAAVLQDMGALRGTEEVRQRHAGQPGAQGGQVPGQRFGPVGQVQRQSLDLVLAQPGGTGGDLLQQPGIAPGLVTAGVVKKSTTGEASGDIAIFLAKGGEAQAGEDAGLQQLVIALVDVARADLGIVGVVGAPALAFGAQAGRIGRAQYLGRQTEAMKAVDQAGGAGEGDPAPAAAGPASWRR